jgi:hypothetical protein
MGLWITGAAFIVLGLPMVWLALRTFGRDRAIRAWPTAPGVIVRSGLEASRQAYRDDDGFRREYDKYTPRVFYTYTVGGRTFEGQAISRQDGGSNRRDRMQAIVDRYPPQRPVTVLHHPADPATAYLEVTRSTGAVILLSWGGVNMLIGLLLLGLWVFL